MPSVQLKTRWPGCQRKAQNASSENPGWVDTGAEANVLQEIVD